MRQLGKARSRGRLLEAARRLFMERGYDAATVRDIAAAAGLSTGAVFASFSDKADLFNQVMDADDRAQLEAMRQADAAPAPVETRLLALLAAAGGHQMGQPQLLKAAEGAAWSHACPQGMHVRAARTAAIGLLREALDAGVRAGELRGGPDLNLIAETLWDCQIAGLRQAISSGAGLEAWRERLGRQIRLLLAGQRPN